MRYTIDNGIIVVTIESFGAELCTITKKDGTDYLCSDSARNWNGRSPILFPNTGAVKDDYALICGKRYPFKQHGFAKCSEFVLVSHTTNKIIFELRWTQATLEIYPFRFILRVTYTLDVNVLRVHSEIINEDIHTLYASLGFHPGFACPLVPSESAEDYNIVFPYRMTASRLILVNSLVRKKALWFWKDLAILPIKEGMFDAGSFSMTDLSSKSIRLLSRKSERFIQLDFDDYPNLVLWAPPQKSITNICIEPWYGIPDAFNTDHSLENKPFTLSVKPREHRELVFTITLG